MNETTITLIGNLTTDPELRFTSTGTAVANFTVATNPRTFDKTSGNGTTPSRYSCAAPYGEPRRRTWPSRCAAVTG